MLFNTKGDCLPEIIMHDLMYVRQYLNILFVIDRKYRVYLSSLE